MLHFFTAWKKEWSPPRPTLLFWTSFGINLFLFVLATIGLLPLPPFAALALFLLLIFLFGENTPSVLFFLLVSTAPIQILSLVERGNIHLRPYQFFLVSILVVLVWLLLIGKKKWKELSFSWPDFFLGLVPLGAFVSALLARASGSLRQACIVFSFYLLYLVARFFLRTKPDLLNAGIIFLGAVGFTTFLGLIQNIAFLLGIEGLSVMPGRPNGLLNEPDWLSLILIVALGILFPLLGWERDKWLKGEGEGKWQREMIALFFLLFLVLTTLILTVSRSGWLGGLILFLFFLAFLFIQKKASLSERLRESLFFGNSVIVLIGLALLLIQDIPLSRFELFHRAASTATSEQSITVSCQHSLVLPQKIETLDELVPLGCRMINLEEVQQEKKAGHMVGTLLRPDPNFSIRATIYSTVRETLRQHPILGIGWGGIGERLGHDSRGASLNASNIFFEIWLGSGLIGILGFVGWLLIVGKRVWVEWRKHDDLFSLSLLISLGGFLVFNLFNSGILLATSWIFFATLTSMSLHVYAHRN